MDELLFLVALIAGIAGSIYIIRYSRARKRGLLRSLKKRRNN